MIAFVACLAHATDYVGADWGGLDLLLVHGDTLQGTFTNIGLLEIPSGGVVSQLGSMLEIEAAEVVIDGELNLTGAGFGPADGPGAGGPGGGDTGGGGGGGSGGAGGRGADGDGDIGGAAGGRTGEETLSVLIPGSGGAAGGSAGGAGGGAVDVIATVRIAVGSAGIIAAEGIPGSLLDHNDTRSGGGGGSGGSIRLDAPVLDLAGVLSVRGGRGADAWVDLYVYCGGSFGGACVAGGGGGGGGGRIAVFGEVVVDPILRLEGGYGGTSNQGLTGDAGAPGTYWAGKLDMDLDDVDDRADNCPGEPNALQEDDDEDGIGNLCDPCREYAGGDEDADGLCDEADPCLLGDPDFDADTVCDAIDVCVFGDDTLDGDADLVPDACDGCPSVPDPAQVDSDGNGVGDACDVGPVECPSGDLDLDGFCDAWELCWGDDRTFDADGDGLCGDLDTCVGLNSTGDPDADGICADLDICPAGDDLEDFDEDGVPQACDLCPIVSDPTQGDFDGDGVGDTCDPCPVDPLDDQDLDGVCDLFDGCWGNDATLDVDLDGFCGDVDLCSGDDISGDADQDAVCTAQDACPGGDDRADLDVDGVPNDCDACPVDPDPLQSDIDLDGTGDACDACPLDADDDSDGDGVCDVVDQCIGDDGSGDDDDDGQCDDVDDCVGDDLSGDADRDDACALTAGGAVWDCDDDDPDTSPGAFERCDGEDNSCLGFLLFDERDKDDDGVFACDGDCDDFLAERSPALDEVCGNGLDDDCDGRDEACPKPEVDARGCTYLGGSEPIASLALLVAVVSRRRRVYVGRMDTAR